MHSKLTAFFIAVLLATGATLAACSSSDPVPDDATAEPAEYDSVSDDDDDDQAGPYEDYQSDEGMSAPAQEGQQPGQPPMGGQQQQPASMPRATGPVATVDGEEIPAEKFNERIDQEAAMIEQQFGQVPPELVDHIEQELIDHLVQQQLLFNAIDDADLDIEDEVVDERLEQFRQEFLDSPQAQMEEDVDFDDVLAQQGMTPEEFRDIVEKEIAMEALLEERGFEHPTDEEVREYYDDHPEDFTEPESIDAQHLLVGVTAADEQAWEEARIEAKELRQQIVEEELSFEELAAQEDHIIAQDAPVYRDQPHQPAGVEDAAFELEDSQISEPIRTQQGWLLIKRLEHHDEEVVAFDEIEDQLEHQLRTRAMGEEVEELIAELRAEATIEIHDENIE